MGINSNGIISANKSKSSKGKDNPTKGNSFELTEKDVSNLRDAFSSFISQDIDPLWDNYQFKRGNVVVRVFTFNPLDYEDDAPDIYLSDAASYKETKTVTFPIGIVLAAGARALYEDKNGEEVHFEPGDFVKLKDEDARFIANPDYVAWVDNGLKNSNAKKVGQAPPAVLAQLRQRYHKNQISANPFEYFITRDDLFTFNLSTANLDGRIKDVNKFLELI